jgi:hypothetical protein
VITLTLQDDGGTASGGIDTLTRTITININPRNHAPSFVVGSNLSLKDTDGQQTLPAWATSILAGPAEESTQKLHFMITVNSNPSLFAAGPTIDADGTLSFTPVLNADGLAQLSIALADDGGTALGGVDQSAPQTFTISIAKEHPWHNEKANIDVDADGTLAPIDALDVINYLNDKHAGAGPVPDDAHGTVYYDVDGDGQVAPIDALTVINNLNAHTVLPGSAGEGEAAANDAGLFYLLAYDIATQKRRTQ